MRTDVPSRQRVQELQHGTAFGGIIYEEVTASEAAQLDQSMDSWEKSLLQLSELGELTRGEERGCRERLEMIPQKLPLIQERKEHPWAQLSHRLL